ncbi:MAG: Gfo/Idh/MocA family oxidoreductase [Candidatus ainarchaeum sp.]|nr:Gfo/Idh/MocA family oxidoreductase [Candidatus ainarchaeum sp.]MDD5096794.1 Gfo/Idh/MocA family oxidoreductase [Candidatus ainarchaeum sp.]
MIGCGSIGRRHIKNLLSLGANVVASDVMAENREWVKQNLGVRVFEKTEDALAEKPDAALVCTPPSTHLPLAKLALEAGCHVFVEKPLSHNLSGIKDIAKLASRKKLIVAVGYNMRFNRSLAKVKEMVAQGAIGKPLSARLIFGQYLPAWRPWQDYRKSYTASKSLGGGIILDGSHEIDYARWLFGEASEIECMAKKVSSLEVETEDVAEMNIMFGGGAIVNIHLDFIRQDYARKCEIVGEKGTISWDYSKGSVVLYDADKKATEVLDLSDDPNAMYVDEMKHFMECVKGGKKPLVSLEEGEKSLALALKAKESAESGRTIRV